MHHIDLVAFAAFRRLIVDRCRSGAARGVDAQLFSGDDEIDANAEGPARTDVSLRLFDPNVAAHDSLVEFFEFIRFFAD